MTIDLADNSPRVSYSVAEGVTQTSFTVSFEFFDDEDLNMYVDGVLKVLTTDYTVTGGDGATGSITMSVTGATGGSTVVITRDIALERTTDFPISGPFNITTLNTELDRLVAIAADLEDQASRSLQLTDYDAAVSLVLPDVDTRKGKVLAFNETTGAVEAGPSSDDVGTVFALAADISALADIEDGTVATDAISTAAANSTSIATVASSIADVNRYANEYKIQASAPAGPSSGDLWYDTTTNGLKYYDGSSWIDYVANAAVSASSAATSETNAASSASAASTSETNAAASASAAATSESNAAASDASAAASLAQVETLFDNFDDRFLGTKTSDPTVDNDGNPLATGSFYYNSTTNELKVYDGASWIAPSTSASNSASAAASSATAAATSASAALASQVAAASSETNAASSASAASTSETNSATSAAAAASSEINAASSASAAATSETNAAASEAAAASSYDQFDDRYLGSKSSDPTLDNDGDALLTGALYYNTTSNQMRVYNGSSWDVAYLPSADYLTVANNLSDVADAATSRTNLGLGTAATEDVGTSANNVVQLDGTGKLPAVDASQLTGIALVPSGLISLWSGTVATIPSGWALCDGTNGTPNLTGRFVVHADADTAGTYNVGSTGGANTVALTNSHMPQHSHSFSGSTSNNGNHSHNTNNTGGHTHNISNTGAHNHAIRGPNTTARDTYAYSFVKNNPVSGYEIKGVAGLIKNANTTYNNYNTRNAAGQDTNSTAIVNTGNHNHNTNNAGSHSHNISNTGAHSHNFSGNTGNAGSGSAHENRPPYYALAYIMKL